MICASREDSDQPDWSVFAVRSKDSQGPNVFFFQRTAKTLIRLGGCPGWSESSLGARPILLVLSCGGSNVRRVLSSFLYELWKSCNNKINKQDNAYHFWRLFNGPFGTQCWLTILPLRPVQCSDAVDMTVVSYTRCYLRWISTFSKYTELHK